MTKDMIIGLLVGLLVGGFVGHQIGASGSSSPAPMAAAPGMPGMPPGMPPGAPAPHAGPGPEVQARISQLQSVVARDPKNVQAWIQLGNDYFDTRQFQKSVEAYGRALELKPNDANVLTDQGVMYRELGQYEKAIENFQKAAKADPKHVQSLFNLGVVYANDLKQPQKATEAWKKVIQVAPGSQHAVQAQAALAELGPAPKAP